MTTRVHLDRHVWTEATLHAIAAEGLQGVVVETLARTLGVTKGSFYWHFANRAALLSAAVARWETSETRMLGPVAGTISDVGRRLLVLTQRAHCEPRLRLTRAFNAAVGHPLVGPAVARVARSRVSFLAECLAAMGMDKAEAMQDAQIAYASYLGAAEMSAIGVGAQTRRELRVLVQRTIARLLPGTWEPGRAILGAAHGRRG